MCMVMSFVFLTALFVDGIQNNPGLVIGTIAVITLTFLLFTNILFGFVLKMVRETSTGNTIKSKRWSLKNFELLQTNTSLLKKKLALAAQYISQVSQDTNQETMDELLLQDEIGQALIKVQQELKDLKADEERRNWITNGLARFGEILRNKSELKEYGYKIISNLVKYLGANQGGIFIKNEDDKGHYLELIACYAYERRKYLEERVYEGSGLLGESMIEKDFIFMTDVPDNYIKITSGLGQGVPRNLVVIPLMFNEQYYGAIELASFSILQPYQVSFLKEVCESIASEIASIKIVSNTQRLLDESNGLTQELREREDEMRKNMEELALTQEGMTRKQTELNSYLQAINNTIASVEFDMAGRFVSANEIFLTVMGYTAKELVNADYTDMMVLDTSVQMMWDNLKMGQFFSGEFKMKNKSGAEMWLSGTFNPITRKGSVPDTIMMYAQFTTQEKERLNDLVALANALKSTLPVVELSDKLICRTGSDKFLKLFGLSRTELRSKTLMDLVAPYYADVFEKIKTEILSKDFSTILLPIQNGDKITTYEASLSIAYNLDKKISRIILILVKEVEEQVSVLAAV